MIKGFRRHGLPVWWRKSSGILLALFWCCGLLVGIGLASGASEHLVSAMRRAAGIPVTILGLLLMTVFPFLISTFAIFRSDPRLLLVIAFLKAVCFGCCSFGISLAFGSAAWLVRFLLLFSDGCTIPVLYWYWLQHISGVRSVSRWELCVLSGFYLLIGSIDYCLISPFLVKLIDT